MNDSGLRAAAELRQFAEQITAGVRKTASEHSTEYAVVNPDAFLMGLMEPYELSLAYLAEHPADDATPIDEAWLRAVGFYASGEWHQRFRLWLCPETTMPGEWFAKYGTEHSAELMKPCKTRGDVRRLASALGIELKEPTQ